MDDKNRSRLAIMLGFMVLVIVPLLITIVALIVQLDSRVSEEEALTMGVSEDIAQIVAEQNDMDLDKVVMREMMNSGDWRAVAVFSKEDSTFGDSMVVILHKEGGEYKTVQVGTSFDDDALRELGMPNDLIRIVEEKDVIAKYSEAMANSDINPRVRYSLINRLPYKSDDLRISYYFEDGVVDSDEVGIPTVTVRGTDAAERKRALDIIKEWGYDPGDYRIEFVNLSNPFIEDSEASLEEEFNVEDGEGP